MTANLDIYIVTNLTSGVNTYFTLINWEICNCTKRCAFLQYNPYASNSSKFKVQSAKCKAQGSCAKGCTSGLVGQRESHNDTEILFPRKMEKCEIEGLTDMKQEVFLEIRNEKKIFP